MDMSFVSSLLLAAVVVEGLTEAWVDADPMEPVRHWVGKWHPLLAVLANCGKCSSFWIALPVGLLAPAGDLPGVWPWWALVAWLGSWRLAGLWHDALSWLAYRKMLAQDELE